MGVSVKDGINALRPCNQRDRIKAAVVSCAKMRNHDDIVRALFPHFIDEFLRSGSQILTDLGYGKLRVIGTPRKQVGLAGFGLEVVEYVNA